MKNNNNAWYWVIGVLVVILVIVFAVRAHNNNAAVSGTASTTATTDQTALTPTEDISAGSADLPTTAGVAPVTISYADALTTYANDRIQFDSLCQATPNTMAVKTGTKIMLDNRAPDARIIHLGDLGDFSVKGYGFKIVDLSLAGLTMNTIAVDCGTSQNVAVLTIQK